MAELTLIDKISSELSKVNKIAPVRLSDDDKDTVLADSLREFSKHVPYVSTADIETETDGSTQSFSLPDNCLGLHINDEYETGVKSYETGDEDTLADVDAGSFEVRNLSSLYFATAPDSGYTLRVQYLIPWTASNIPSWADRAVVYFAVHFAVDTWAVLSSVNVASSVISTSYREMQESYYEKAMSIIDNFAPNSGGYNSKQNIHARRV